MNRTDVLEVAARMALEGAASSEETADTRSNRSVDEAADTKSNRSQEDMPDAKDSSKSHEEGSQSSNTSPKPPKKKISIKRDLGDEVRSERENHRRNLATGEVGVPVISVQVERKSFSAPSVVEGELLAPPARPQKKKVTIKKDATRVSGMSGSGNESPEK